MKNIFNKTNLKILLAVLLIATIGLAGFYGYNEYIYQKVGVCITEGNYTLAENYIDTISPSYKDLRNIKNLISIINSVENADSKDLERTFSRLESFKGFKNENVNQVYNSLMFSVYKDLLTANIYKAAETQTQIPVIITTSESTASYTTTTSQPSTETTEALSQTEYRYETTAPTAVIQTTTEYYTTETTYVTTTQQQTTTVPDYSTDTVYYVESGEVYHLTADCRTLSRSTNILSGPIPEGRRACKVCG